MTELLEDTEDRQVLRLSSLEEDSAQKSPTQIPKSLRH